MKPKKIVRYRISVSVKFPAKHPRAGEPTYFPEKVFIEKCSDAIKAKIIEEHGPFLIAKKHTIRVNYELWAKRFEKIDRGEAVLELYSWTGKPRRSKTETICQLRKEDGIGIQKLFFLEGYWTNFFLIDENDYCTSMLVPELAKNDGLSFDDFKAWFKGYDLSKPMAIIHFTYFRY